MALVRRTSRWLLGVAALSAACRTTAPPVVERVPDPIAPPVAGTQLTAELQDAARSAVVAAEHGDWSGAARHLADLPPSHPVSRLVALEVRFLRGEDVSHEATALASEYAEYGSAWALAEIASRKAGDLAGALAAARRVNALQPDPKWERAIGDLERAEQEEALRGARSLLARGNAPGALRAARQLLEKDPESVAARLLAVRAALAGGQTREAATLVTALPDTPEGLESKGRVAEALGQWEMATELYGKLPTHYPGKCELVEGAREQARLANAPPYLARALAGSSVTRGDLAALLVWEVPVLRDRASGQAVLFEDIVQVPERADIVTATRAGVMVGDALARRFSPGHLVGARELKDVLGRLASLLTRPAPQWCTEGASSGCLDVPATIDGKSVAELIRRVAGEGEEPCTQR
jgi:tetratricopeptide (TPR) repeat protein